MDREDVRMIAEDILRFWKELDPLAPGRHHVLPLERIRDMGTPLMLAALVITMVGIIESLEKIEEKPDIVGDIKDYILKDKENYE